MNGCCGIFCTFATLTDLQNIFKVMKPIKKNTTYRRFRAWEIRLDRRQQQREIVPDTVDDTRRSCSNCGTRYTGRICPQCGQVGTWSRYTWRQAFLNLLDIWGLGNRPMFRTLKELFWRPGYMVRDYLNGHRQFYFPPFKLLAVVVVLLLFTSWVTGVKVDSLFGDLAHDLSGKEMNLSGPLLVLAGALIKFIEFLSSNLLYEWLFLGVVAVFCVWIAFYRYRRVNLVETYIFLVFLIAQQLLCRVPQMLGGWLSDSSLLGFVRLLYGCATILLLVMTFRQFYGLKWKTTVWRLLLSLVVFAVMVSVTVIIAVAFTSGGIMFQVHAVIVTLFLIGSFVLANWLIDKNKPTVHPAIITTSKLLMLSVFMTPMWSIALKDMGINLWVTVACVLGYGVLSVAFSLLPIPLYNKTRSKWLSIIVPTLLVFLLIVIPISFT